MYVFMYDFWLRWVFRLSLVEASGGSSSLPCVGFPLPWLLLLQGTGSRHMGLRSCGTWALGPMGLSSCGAGLVALWCVGSPKIRGWTCVPCIGRQILIPCTTREVLGTFLKAHFTCKKVQLCISKNGWGLITPQVTLTIISFHFFWFLAHLMKAFRSSNVKSRLCW